MKRKILIGILCLAAMVLLAWGDLSAKPANDRIVAGVKKMLKMNPAITPIYDEAMLDGVLTTIEAKDILDEFNKLKASYN